MTEPRVIPTSIKKGTLIVECATGRELEVYQDYRATEPSIGGHFEVLARYLDEEDVVEIRKCRRKLAQYRFGEIGQRWDFK